MRRTAAVLIGLASLAVAPSARAGAPTRPGIDEVRTTIVVDTKAWPLRIGQRTLFRADPGSPAIRALWLAKSAHARDEALAQLLSREGAIGGGGFGGFDSGEPGMDLFVRDGKAQASRYVWQPVTNARDLDRYPWTGTLDDQRVRYALAVDRDTTVAVGAGVELDGNGRIEAVSPVPAGGQDAHRVTWQRVTAGSSVSAEVKLPWRAAASLQPLTQWVRDAGFLIVTAMLFAVVLVGVPAAPAARRLAKLGLVAALTWAAIITMFDVAAVWPRVTLDAEKVIAGFGAAAVLLALLVFSRRRHDPPQPGEAQPGPEGEGLRRARRRRERVDAGLGALLLALTTAVAVPGLTHGDVAGILGVALMSVAALVAALGLVRVLGAAPRPGAPRRLGSLAVWLVAGISAAVIGLQWALSIGQTMPEGGPWTTRWTESAPFGPYALLSAVLLGLTVAVAVALLDRLDDPDVPPVGSLLEADDALGVCIRIAMAAMVATFVTVKITVGSVPMPVPFALAFTLLAVLFRRGIPVRDQLPALPGRRREVLEAALAAERLDRRAAATHTTWFDGDEDETGRSYRQQRQGIAQARRALEIGGRPPARLAFAVGPGAGWLESARAGVRVGLWFAIVPVGFWLGDLFANRWDGYWHTPFGMLSLAQGLVGELAFWLVAAFVLGALFAHLPGPNGFVKGGLLGLGLALQIAFTVGVLADAHASAWQLRCVMLVIYLGAVGTALDVVSVRAAGLHWRAMLDLYRLRVARFSIAYGITVIVTLVGLGQQLATGADLPGVLQALGSLVPSGPD